MDEYLHWNKRKIRILGPIIEIIAIDTEIQYKDEVECKRESIEIGWLLALIKKQLHMVTFNSVFTDILNTWIIIKHWLTSNSQSR